MGWNEAWLLEGSDDRACGVAVARGLRRYARAQGLRDRYPARQLDPAGRRQPGLGRPTFVGQFAPADWIYVSRETTQLAFRNPRVTKQTTLVVHFDKAGNVTGVAQSGKELAMNLEPTARKTPTMGKQKSFFQELFGNIGSVNSGGIPGQ